jgi:cyclopropane fatty-acyl-phospholipid synthase-like methyltransferase
MIGTESPADLHSGMRFLDVSAGSGALSIPAARLGARIMAIDQSPVMLELLAARACKESLNVETQVITGAADFNGDWYAIQSSIVNRQSRDRAVEPEAKNQKPAAKSFLFR